MELNIAGFPEGPEPEVEVVERKGPGHPDTICDALAEHLSRALTRWYHEHFGLVLHHNVDKALLVAGAARPAGRRPRSPNRSGASCAASSSAWGNRGARSWTARSQPAEGAARPALARGPAGGGGSGARARHARRGKVP